MNLLNKLRNTINSLEEIANNFEKTKVQRTHENKQKENSERENEYQVASLPINWTNHLTHEKKAFEFWGINFNYQKTNPTCFYITDNDFDVAEICNVYLFSINGQEFDYSNLDLQKSTMIKFGIPEVACNPEIQEQMDRYVEARNAGRAIIEKKEIGYLKYRIHGETCSHYYDCHLYQIGDIRFKIDLVINKTTLNKEHIQNILNEYYAIINTLQITI